MAAKKPQNIFEQILVAIEHISDQIDLYFKPRLTKLTVTIIVEGEPMDSIAANQKAPIIVAGLDQNGAPFPIAGLPQNLSSSDPTIAAIDTTDPANPMLVGVPTSAGGTVVVTAAVTRADGSVITGTDTVTVTSVVPPATLTTVNVTLGTPVAR